MCFLIVLLSLCLGVCVTPFFHRLDLQLFDVESKFAHRVLAKKIVVVAVDERTIDAIGQWPLSAATQADLIDRLTDSRVSAVGFDFMPRAAGDSAGSVALGNAMRRNGKIVTKLLPAEYCDDHKGSFATRGTLAGNAAGQTEVDRDLDGLVRSFPLFGQGVCPRWHMSALVAALAGFTGPSSALYRAASATSRSNRFNAYLPLDNVPTYEKYSYVDVLRGQVPEKALEGRIVLVGVTAEALAAHLATPAVRNPAIAGVEFIAEAVNALMTSSLICMAEPWWQVVFSEAFVLLVCLAVYVRGPRGGFAITVLLAVSVIAASIVLLTFWHIYLSPYAGLLTCLLAYPLWSWRRQEALLRFLCVEAGKAAWEPSLADRHTPDEVFGDFIQRQLTVAGSLFERAHRQRIFVSKWVDSLPEATLVTDGDGYIILSNERVKTLCEDSQLKRFDWESVEGRHVSDVLFEITASHRAIEFASQALELFALWTSGHDLPASDEARFSQGFEVTSARGGRSLLIKCAHIKPSAQLQAALIFHLADLSSVRKAERQRDTALRFVSHDMRAPQAAILALVEQMQQEPPRFTTRQFATLVGQYATTALGLADDFLFLARAESLPLKLTRIDPALVLGDAVDDLWPQASSRSMAVNLAAEPGTSVIADVQLLRRAFSNLIGNAIKFSPKFSTVDVRLAQTDRHLQISVTDRGIGIPAHKSQNLFSEFSRLDEGDPRAGHGLGLAFVKTVIDSLGGKIEVNSAIGQGTTFIVFLPKVESGGGH